MLMYALFALQCWKYLRMQFNTTCETCGEREKTEESQYFVSTLKTKLSMDLFLLQNAKIIIFYNQNTVNDKYFNQLH